MLNQHQWSCRFLIGSLWLWWRLNHPLSGLSNKRCSVCSDHCPYHHRVPEPHHSESPDVHSFNNQLVPKMFCYDIQACKQTSQDCSLGRFQYFWLPIFPFRTLPKTNLRKCIALDLKDSLRLLRCRLRY